MKNFQLSLRAWAETLFGVETSSSRRTRALRFYEEALELVQTTGLTDADLAPVRQMVWSRPVGEMNQEIGGTMVTLLLLAELHGLDVETELKREVLRIHTPEVMEKCRRRQIEKKTMGL